MYAKKDSYNDKTEVGPSIWILHTKPRQKYTISSSTSGKQADDDDNVHVFIPLINYFD